MLASNSVCCPFGPLSAAPIVVAIISFILSMVGSFACTFWVYNVAGSTQGFGLWTVEQVCIGSGCTYTCVNYSNLASFDAAWQAGRAFSMIAAIFAIVLLVIACTFACLPWPPKMFKITGLLAIWTGVCQIISLVSWIDHCHALKLATDCIPAHFPLPPRACHARSAVLGRSLASEGPTRAFVRLDPVGSLRSLLPFCGGSRRQCSSSTRTRWPRKR